MTVVTDEPALAVAGALLAAAVESGCETREFLVERHAPRPVSRFPPEIVSAVAGSHLTALCMNPHPGELRARTQFIEVVREKGIRHAHIISVTPAAMRTGMRADYHEIDRIQERILSRIGPVSRVRVTSPAGTDCEATFSPSHRWVKLNGLIRPGHMQNLPSGEVFTCPETMDGAYVANKLATDWFGQKYGDLARFPVTFEIAGGRVRDVRSDNDQLARDLSLYIRSNENADRVAEFGIGTNLWMSTDPESLPFSDKVPGAHISLGEPIGAETGAGWTSRTRVTLVGTGASIVVDGAPIMLDGVFLPELLRS